MSSLKNISQTMQNELDDQADLLNDLGREMDTADSKMQTVMKKITKVLHMSSGNLFLTRFVSYQNRRFNRVCFRPAPVDFDRSSASGYFDSAHIVCCLTLVQIKWVHENLWNDLVIYCVT